MFERAVVVIPTFQAARHWHDLVGGLAAQQFPSQQVVVIDSGSTDGTAELAAESGFTVLQIPQDEFNHGGTRWKALQAAPWAEIVVYLTQDAVLATPDSIANLVKAFEDPLVGAAGGRQLPRREAGIVESHARIFNYPPVSAVRNLESRTSIGIKATFLSNSFAAYRVAALRQIGGFPVDTIMAEDALAAGRMLSAGWKIAYVADALVYHSHGYTIMQEFRRYFDTGVYHNREAWLLDTFGSAGGEGKRFVISEWKTLFPRHAHLLPGSFFRTFAKAAGYWLGRREASLSLPWKKRLSMHKGFWKN